MFFLLSFFSSLSLFFLFSSPAAAASFPVPDYNSISNQIAQLLVTNQDSWPIDIVPSNPSSSSYGPFFIRLAWHCSGSYRVFDGRGGCDGGRIRFHPERSWADNTNLDKALNLLRPIKLANPDISWGDLIVLAGNTAIQTMGGPILGYCGGRKDDVDGKDSLPLGPSSIQRELAPCEVNGQCSSPLGTTTIGLIYVNPEGPMGNPDPVLSAPQIRDTFGRMGMNDSETVALIGGGHTFGKAHGACPTGAGPDPDHAPANPWPGTCTGGNSPPGKGANTFTSGFEGRWTYDSATWTNDYFNNLLVKNYSVVHGPGGHYQWQPTNGEPLMMLTTDISLLHDPSYLFYSQYFMKYPDQFSEAFMNAWYKLTSRDMGPVTRCVGPNVPPAQPFQNPLPPTPSVLADFNQVRQLIVSSLYATINQQSSLTPGDVVDGKYYYGALYVQLAWSCANTFRSTDYRGGCNGATIRYPPQINWSSNVGMDKVLQYLGDNVIKKYSGPGYLSWADTIVLAGQVALENAGAETMKFCGGRVDAADGSGANGLQPRVYRNAYIEVWDNMEVMGLTTREMVALQGMLRSPLHQQQLGYSGSYTSNITTLTNSYYEILLNNSYTYIDNEFVSGNGDAFMTPTDMPIKYQPEFLVIAEEYYEYQNTFLHEFSLAWTKMMNADRFDGPDGNVCNK